MRRLLVVAECEHALVNADESNVFTKRIQSPSEGAIMTQASSKTLIHAPADAIWQVISDFGAACQYLVMVDDCSMAGQGIGALRTLTYADGSVIVERLEALDDAARRLNYALLTDTPFRDCLTTVSVRDLGRGQSEVTWTATFDADGLPASEAVEMLEGAFGLNSRALQHFIATTRATTA